MEKESYLTEINRNIKEHLDLSSRYEKLLKKGYSSLEELTLQKSRYLQQSPNIVTFKLNLFRLNRLF